MSFGEDPLKSNPNPYAAPGIPDSGMLPPHRNDLIDAKLAGRANRFGARLIDGIVSLVVTGPLMYATGYFQRAVDQTLGIAEVALWSVGGLVLFVVIHGYFLATRGQTVGKMAAGIRIVDRDTRQIPSLGKILFARELPMGIVGLIPVIGGLLALVNVLFIFGAERRCVHDMIGNTLVEDC